MKIDPTKIKTVNINMGDQHYWNAKTHNIILSYDPKTPIGISIRAVSVEEDAVPIIDLSQAQHIIKKFTLK
jgi:hypothetical protein